MTVPFFCVMDEHFQLLTSMFLRLNDGELESQFGLSKIESPFDILANCLDLFTQQERSAITRCKEQIFWLT